MFDLEKADFCATQLKLYFKETSKTINANVEIPNDIIPGTNNHIVYLFYSCLLDYGMRSKNYHQNLINTYKNHKEIFNPKFVIANYLNNELELFAIIKDNIHPRYPNVALKKWLVLSKFLNDNFPKESLKEKITSLKSYKELYNFIKNINGYGQKTGGLLLRLIYESGICHFNDDIDNIPIDRHDIEISYLNGIIKKENLNSKEIEQLGKTWIKVAHQNNIKASDIDKYLWIIGNSLCSKKECNNCPINKNCQKKKGIQ